MNRQPSKSAKTTKGSVSPRPKPKARSKTPVKKPAGSNSRAPSAKPSARSVKAPEEPLSESIQLQKVLAENLIQHEMDLKKHGAFLAELEINLMQMAELQTQLLKELQQQNNNLKYRHDKMVQHQDKLKRHHTYLDQQEKRLETLVLPESAQRPADKPDSGANGAKKENLADVAEKVASGNDKKPAESEGAKAKAEKPEEKETKEKQMAPAQKGEGINSEPFSPTDGQSETKMGQKGEANEKAQSSEKPKEKEEKAEKKEEKAEKKEEKK